MKCDNLQRYSVDIDYVPNDDGAYMDADEVNEAIAELKQTIDKLVGVKKSAEQILQNLLDCGLIKEWYFNGKFNAVLKDDDPHMQIAELKHKLVEKDKEIALLKERICNGDVSRSTWIDDCFNKDKEIARLNDKLQNVSELLTETREWLIESQKMHKRCAENAIKKLRHHKYKRCLAMAKVCYLRFVRYENYLQKLCASNATIAAYKFRRDMYDKWEKRWLELAERFK